MSTSCHFYTFYIEQFFTTWTAALYTLIYFPKTKGVKIVKKNPQFIVEKSQNKTFSIKNLKKKSVCSLRLMIYWPESSFKIIMHVVFEQFLRYHRCCWKKQNLWLLGLWKPRFLEKLSFLTGNSTHSLRAIPWAKLPRENEEIFATHKNVLKK